MLSHQSWALRGDETCSSFNRVCIHMTSGVALAKVLYSASVLDLDTVACFLALQETRLAPKNTAKPPVDLRSFGHPAQSTSANVLTVVELDLTKHRPSFNVPLTYLRILLTTSQCTVVGECKNWQALFTEKERSGRVIVKY
jgi:hypothetical protein